MSDDVTPPQLWWSNRLGLLTVCDDDVAWRYETCLAFLRHDGLPNELPADAVRLEPTTRKR